MKRMFLFLLPIILFSGCFSLMTDKINKVMQSWEGHHYGNLIAGWGPPQQVFDDGFGGRILVYTAQRQWIAPGSSKTYTTVRATAYDHLIWGSATTMTTYTLAQVYGYTAYRMFWIDEEGYIYRWAWRGL